MTLRFGQTGAMDTTIVFTADGRDVPARPGETVAAALYAAGIRILRTSPAAGTPRGMFCLMGACQECLVRIGGQRRLACQELATPGLCVETGPIA